MDPRQFAAASRNRLSDRDMLLDLMITEKYLAGLYNQGVLEAASSMLANTFERLQSDTHDNARTIFNALVQRSWYNPQRAEKNERFQKRKQNQLSQTFNTTADSKYAVTSGTRRFGRHLSQGQRLGKNGNYMDQKSETQSQDWQ